MTLVTSISAQETCPCRNHVEQSIHYADCCQPYHLGLATGKGAPTPEALMRSRFSAYVLGLADYLKHTWHPDTCPTPLEVQADSHWKQLQIIDAKGNTVHFKAIYHDDPHAPFSVLEEVSLFEKLNGLWVYVSGEVNQYDHTPSRNDTCLCGSGKKYKKCCGR